MKLFIMQILGGGEEIKLLGHCEFSIVSESAVATKSVHTQLVFCTYSYQMWTGYYSVEDTCYF
jgi:hypothetical protein